MISAALGLSDPHTKMTTQFVELSILSIFENKEFQKTVVPTEIESKYSDQ